VCLYALSPLCIQDSIPRFIRKLGSEKGNTTTPSLHSIFRSRSVVFDGVSTYPRAFVTVERTSEPLCARLGCIICLGKGRDFVRCVIAHVLDLENRSREPLSLPWRVIRAVFLRPCDRKFSESGIGDIISAAYIAGVVDIILNFPAVGALDSALAIASI